MQQKQTLFFHSRQFNEHGYTFTEITAYLSKGRTLAECIDGCIDNKAGYGSPEAAQKMLERYRMLEELGYTHSVDSGIYEPRVVFTWQHYVPKEKTSPGNEYCEPRVEVGEKFHSIETNLRLARDIAKRARKYSSSPNRYGAGRMLDIERPEAVLVALRKAKTYAREVEHVKLPESFTHFHVWKEKPKTSSVSQEEVVHGGDAFANRDGCSS